MVYEWVNSDTKEVVEHDHWSVPPDLPGKWQRAYSVAIGTVRGGAGSPARTSVKK